MKKIYNVLMALNWYHPKIHLGIAKYARQHGWHLNSSMALDNKPPLGWTGDGVITQTGSEVIDSFIDSLKCPTVRLDKVVSDDNQAIGALAATYFYKRKFRNYIACPISSSEAIPLRTTVFIKTVNKYGFDCDLLPINGCSDWVKKREIISFALKTAKYPLAVFAADDNHAAEIIEICLKEGIQIPEQVSILGVRNDSLICESLAVSLSSIENHLEIQGYKAAEVLDSLMRKDGKFISMEIEKPYIVERKSTDILSHEHPEVVRALTFIAENFSNNISVDDVVDATALSKRGLQYAFSQFLGRSIGKEIMRVKLDNAITLMESTNDKLLKIATLSGFNNIVSFQQAFKQRFSMSPGNYRKTIKK